MRHYQYRSPDQIARRLEQRALVPRSFRHEIVGGDGRLFPVNGTHPDEPWRERVAASGRLDVDAGDNRLVVRDPEMELGGPVRSRSARWIDRGRRSLRRAPAAQAVRRWLRRPGGR
jgi:hypothetical protein